jgi:hypothetical protein
VFHDLLLGLQHFQLRLKHQCLALQTGQLHGCRSSRLDLGGMRHTGNTET